MYLTSVRILLLSFIFGNFLVNTTSKMLDVEKIYKAHAECNGENVPLPVEWMPAAVVAATQCSFIDDEYCQKQCIAFTYPGVMKNGRPDMVWMRKESKKMQLSKRNEKAREELLKGAEKCNKDLPKLEKPDGSDSCPEAKKYEKCIEEEFKYACKGKKRPNDDSGSGFLDEN